MFKGFARKSAEMTLSNFLEYYFSASANQDRILTLLAGFFRNMIKVSESYFDDKVISPKRLHIAINRLVLTTDKREALEIATEMQKSAKSLKNGPFKIDDKYSMLFVASYFHIMSQSPPPRQALDKAFIGAADKNYSLLEKFQECLHRIFVGNEDMLLTDIVLDAFEKETSHAH